MCFYVNVNIEKEKLNKKITFINQINSSYNRFSSIQNEVSAFTFPDLPILTLQNNLYNINDFKWGLIPDWVGKEDISHFSKNTLNARIETIDEKKSFRNYIHQKGVLFLNGFYEWQHVGKNKNKFYIHSSENDFLCIAVIYNNFNIDDESINSFSMITTSANKLMSEIHNTKKRMPLMIKSSFIKDWLNPYYKINEMIDEINLNSYENIVAEQISQKDNQISLF